MVGILFEGRGGNSFKNIHINFPSLLSQYCNQYKLEQFIHLSALGINEAKDSKYAMSKLDGEAEIQKNFSKVTILRPSVVYSVDDNFTTTFMSLLNNLPIFPLYYSGNTKFMPIHCSDLTNVIHHVISKNIISKTIECIGPETISFKEILEKLLKLIGKKRVLIPIPLVFANLLAFFLEKFPKPLLTRDQLILLKYNNILSGKYKTNNDIGAPSTLLFEEEVKKYSYMWREGGKFSILNINTKKNIKNENQ